MESWMEPDCVQIEYNWPVLSKSSVCWEFVVIICFRVELLMLKLIQNFFKCLHLLLKNLQTVVESITISSLCYSQHYICRFNLILE